MNFFRQLVRFVSWEYRRYRMLQRSSPAAKRALAQARAAATSLPCPYCTKEIDNGWRWRWHMSGCNLPTWRELKERERGLVFTEALLVLVIVGVISGIGWFFFVGLPKAERRNTERQQHETEERWSGKCHDESWLLATTSGSPDRAACPNRSHRMRVQVATHPSNEEAAALVFCECQRDSEPPGP